MNKRVYFSQALFLVILLLASSSGSKHPEVEVSLRGGWSYSPVDSYQSWPDNSFLFSGNVGVVLNRNLWLTTGFTYMKKAMIEYDWFLVKPLFYNTVEFFSINGGLKLDLNRNLWKFHPFMGVGIGIHVTKGEELGMITGVRFKDTKGALSLLMKSGLELPLYPSGLLALVEGGLEAVSQGMPMKTDVYNAPQSWIRTGLSLGLGYQF